MLNILRLEKIGNVWAKYDEDVIIPTTLFWTLNKELIYLSQVWPQTSMQYVK